MSRPSRIAVIAFGLCITSSTASFAQSQPCTPGTRSGGGNLVHGPSARMSLRVAGHAPCHDMMVFSETASLLGGTLELRFINGFVPSPGDEFLIIDANRITGDFSSVLTQGLNQPFTHRINHADGDWYFVVVPEPAVLLMLVSSAMLLLSRRRSDA